MNLSHRTAALCACSSCFDWTKTYAKEDWGYSWYYAALAPLLGEREKSVRRYTASLEPYSGAIYYYILRQQKVLSLTYTIKE